MISVVLPVYNCANYLENTLRGFRIQTNQNFELIFVDDASTDNSKDVIFDVATHISLSFRYYCLPKHSGASTARNFGAQHAKGELICFIDSDDIVEPEFLDAFIKEYHRTQYDMCFCNYQILDQRGDRDNSLRVMQNYFPYGKKRLLRLSYLLGHTKICHCTVAYRRSFLQAQKLRYVEGCQCAEDTEFICKAIFRAHRIISIDKVLYTYCMHSPSLSHSLPDERAFGAYQAMKRAQKAIPLTWRPIFSLTKRARIHGFILNWFLQSNVPLPYKYCSTIEILFCLIICCFISIDKEEHKSVLRAYYTRKLKL